MKASAVFLVLFLCGIVNANATTSVTSASVSGHWTLTGSPYKVFNDISIYPGDTLAIDPGVEVIFQGAYQFSVLGILYAAGTAAQPISFHVQDTTGWSNFSSTAGGWKGIFFGQFGVPSTDSCSFRYCNVSDMKSGGLILYYQNLSVKNCNLYHNYSDAIGGSIDSNHVFEISGCNIYSNSGESIGITNFYGGSTYIHNCSIHDNSGPNSIVHLLNVKLLFQNNEVYNNNATGAYSLQSALAIMNGYGEVSGNKIYNNASEFDAALLCNGGIFDINRNLVCNNKHLSGTCGAVDGGGGIHVSSNGTTDTAITFFSIRNNVIANNYSPFVGGGIKVFWANVSITNNQIINNIGFLGSGGIHLTCDTFSAVIKNNVFYGNQTTAYMGITANVSVDLAKNITYEHNWSQNPYSSDFFAASGSYNLLGDTTTNVVGTNPGLINPTATADVTELAIPSHNFSLLPASPCINKGDTTGISCDSVDYAGNVRIFGPKIDIGAFEFNPTEYATLAAPGISAPKQLMGVYPNPASTIIFVSVPVSAGSIQIQDAAGRVITEKKVTNTLTTFDVHALPHGLYIAVWNNGSGQQTTQKIVVE